MPENTIRPDPIVPQKLYVAVLRSDMVRDVQFCATQDNDYDSEDWLDLEDAELFLGIYFGTPDAVRKSAAQYGNTVPENIRIIGIPDAVRLT